MKVQFCHHCCGLALKQMFTFPLPNLPSMVKSPGSSRMSDELIDQRGKKPEDFLMGCLPFCQINGINLPPVSVQLLHLKQSGNAQLGIREEKLSARLDWIYNSLLRLTMHIHISYLARRDCQQMVREFWFSWYWALQGISSGQQCK